MCTHMLVTMLNLTKESLQTILTTWAVNKGILMWLLIY